MREVFSFILQGTLVSKPYSSGLSSGHSPRCYVAKMALRNQEAIIKKVGEVKRSTTLIPKNNAY